jgi:hypothetical protein
LTIVPPPWSSIALTAARGVAEGGEEVQLQRGFEVVVADVEESVQPQLDAADVVHEHVDPAVLLDGRVDEACGAGGIDEIERDASVSRLERRVADAAARALPSPAALLPHEAWQ